MIQNVPQPLLNQWALLCSNQKQAVTIEKIMLVIKNVNVQPHRLRERGNNCTSSASLRYGYI